MRSFVQGYVLDHALFILIDYAFIAFVLWWLAKLRLRSKAEDIRDELISFKWDSSTFIAHFIVPGIVMALSLTFFGADFGWLIDLFCWIGAIFSAILWFSFFLQNEVFFMKHEFVLVPPFRKRRDYYYESIQHIDVVKNNQLDKASGKVKADYSIKIQVDEEEESLSGEHEKIKSLLVLLKEHVDHKKFSIVEEGDLEQVNEE
ncbi:MAG: hypothetical protein R8G66_19995 [Cytophagales bacterium]|nr:hypothetical protein [Cytophagales bacterium]